MPRAIVKQPNGLYAVWSTVVDAFLYTDLDLETAFERTTRSHSPEDYHRTVENIENTGRQWDWASTWEEAIGHNLRGHGESTPDEAERLDQRAKIPAEALSVKPFKPPPKVKPSQFSEHALLPTWF